MAIAYCINDDDIDAHNHKGARIPRRLEADHLEVIVYYVTLMMTYILDAHSQKGARIPRRLGMFIISRLYL
jgi:protein involved in ribonucleotide reduction